MNFFEKILTYRERLREWLKITFKGRVSKKEFFYSVFGSLFLLLFVSIILIVIYGLLELLLPFTKPFLEWPVVLIIILLAIYQTIFVASMSVRRLHDLNLSGYFYLLYIILFFGNSLFSVIAKSFPMLSLIIFLLSIIFVIYLLFFKGTKGPNKYGPDPLEKNK